MMLKKVSIDDLIILLSGMRKVTTYVDMTIQDGNVLRVRPSDPPVKPAQENNNELPNNLNQLLG